MWGTMVAEGGFFARFAISIKPDKKEVLLLQKKSRANRILRLNLRDLSQILLLILNEL